MGLFGYNPSKEDIDLKASKIKIALATSGVTLGDKEIAEMAKKELIKEHVAQEAKHREDQKKLEQEKKDREQAEKEAKEKTKKEQKEKKDTPKAVATDIKTTEDTGGNGKASGKIKKPKVKLELRKKKIKPKPFKVTDSSKETLNLHATKIMPKDDSLYFNDPKAVELPIKIVPRLKLIVEAMSTNVKKPMRPWIVYAFASVIAVLAISILFSAVITPQQDQASKRAIEFLQECARLNQTNCAQASVPSSAGGGGFFEFKPINPFEVPDFTKPK